jgi:hypothetical protein
MDGPAVTVFFSPNAISSPNPAPPNVQVTIWRSIGDLAGNYALAGSGAQGDASRVSPEGEFAESAAGGSITVLSVSADLTVIGNLDVTFPSGTRLKGGFTAPWIARSVFCG